MLIRIIVGMLLMLTSSVLPCSADELTTRKVILSQFKVKNDSIVDLPKTSPYWPEVDRHILNIDDQRHIYVLNLWNNEILIFKDQGKLLKKYSLPIQLYRFEHRNGKLEVSGDGKRFFVEGYDQAKKIKQVILGKSGTVVKQFIAEDEIVWNFPDSRLCDKPYYLFKKGGLVYDENFKKLHEQLSRFSDSEGRYEFDTNKHLLMKYSWAGAKIWEKQFNTDMEILGVDGGNHLYMTGRLKNGDPDYLYKIDSKGNILAKTLIPNPFPLFTQEEKDEFYALVSEEPFASFELTCNGDVYLIFRLNKLPKPAFNRWLKGGEYFVYKFETKL